jgi:hypothetical protein
MHSLKCFCCLPVLLFICGVGGNTAAQHPTAALGYRTVPIRHYRFSTVDKDAQMWSALYAASNGKLYVGLCTHADAANVYEFDPASEKMRHLANLTVISGERGRGTWTNGKIHVQMQELDGYVYFGSLSEDNGPPAIDPTTYGGPYWYRIEMKTGKVEQLDSINSFWGILGQAMDKKRRLIYGLAEDGHLYRYWIDEHWTEDLGRVDDWDICRTIFIDGGGNVYGSYPPGRVWKYDAAKDRIFNLEHIVLPIVNQSRTMANPMLDRKAQWRIVEWDAADRAAYGIIGGSNLLFKFEPYAGPEGKVTPLALMVPPHIQNGDTMDYPAATLTLTIDRQKQRIYYIPVTAGDFDYGAVSRDLPAYSLLMTYDLKTGKRSEIGLLRGRDGRYAYGMGGAKVDRDGRLWFVGAFEEPDPNFAAGKIQGRYPYSVGLGVYEPAASKERDR